MDMLRKALIGVIMSGLFGLAPHSAIATDAAQLSKDAQAALRSLYAQVPAAKQLGQNARAVLVFPQVTKASLRGGGQYGDGAPIKGGKTVGYYDTPGPSAGPH